MKAQHAHHIFCQFASEYFGDSRASSMLFIEYQQARLDAAAEIFMSSQVNTSSASNLFHDLSFKTERAQLFQYWFDRYCEHAFLNCMNSYNKMTMEIGGVLMRPCLMDLVLVGWNKLKEMNVKKN